MSDGRCRFGPRAKREMVARLLAGERARAIARSMGCSPTTVTTARDRWLAASEQERHSGAWCRPRRPVPKSCPWALSAEQERAILQARQRTSWGPMRLTVLCGHHRSTIWKVLKRHGVSRRRRGERQTHRRYEWAQPGALLHIDAFSVQRFDRPGHWAHGDRSVRERGLGKSVVVGLLDDHSRIVYAELHAAETATAVTATLRRGIAWMHGQGCGPVQALMSDNAKAYTSHAFQAALTELDIRHILTPPYTPRWNGKLERFWQTLDQEWAHSRQWPTSATRDRALRSYLRYYNRRRPHSAAGGRPPISRVHQVRKQDS
jgi:transposase InsO family protein